MGTDAADQPLIACDRPASLLGSQLAALLAAQGLPLLQRAPGERAERWHTHEVGGIRRQFAQPLTFTPYASSRPCSARCHFCSENLRRSHAPGPAASLLRPDADYFTGLRRALLALHGLPRSYSLSGLEASDDPDWLLQLLQLLGAPEFRADALERVLYSNGAGLIGARGEALLDALQGFRLSWLELSRHHFDADANQAIMRFRDGLAIRTAAAFRQLVDSCRGRFPLRLVCLLQQGGIATPGEVARYLDWAATLGVETVIFRELSRLDEGYRDNATRRSIDNRRIAMEPLLAACLADADLGPTLQAQALTDGYYFWNLQLRHASGLRVIFECSDYRAMHARHAEPRVYKLVYFADGQLCAGWQPGDNLLLDCRHG